MINIKLVLRSKDIKTYLEKNKLQTNGRTLTQVDCSKNYKNSLVYREGFNLSEEELKLLLSVVIASPKVLRIIEIMSKGGFSPTQKYSIFKLADEKMIFESNKQ